MKKKTLWLVVILFGLTLITLISWVLLTEIRRELADKYRFESGSSQHQKILSLEKANFLFSSQENAIALAQAYAERGETERSIKILKKWKTLPGYNELGKLFLKQGEYLKAAAAFESANLLSENQTSLQGWLEAEMKRNESSRAKLLVERLTLSFPKSENYCLAAFFYLGTEPEKAFDFYNRAQKCESVSELNNFFKKHTVNQNQQFLRLEGASLHYHLEYFQLALAEVLALQKENNHYRDAFVLGRDIYSRLGDDSQSRDQKKRIEELDPLY